MPTLDEINQKYTLIHAEITYDYYTAHKISKEVFDRKHELCWLNHELERLKLGLVEGITEEAANARIAEIESRVKTLEGQ
jgi:hypothetical protein